MAAIDAKGEKTEAGPNASASAKAFNSSVVFCDIVGFAKKPVSSQIVAKDRFAHILGVALRDLPAEDRLVLDTGDGAAISFLGDCADALHFAIALRDAAIESGKAVPAEEAELRSFEPFALRIGINLGPIKLVRTDAHAGLPTVTGDGINVAQRLMQFAHPNQAVVSRSFYDALSSDYPALFKFEGSRTDKHVREHEIYVVGELAQARGKTNSPAHSEAATLKVDDPIEEQRKRLLVSACLLSLLVFGLAVALVLRSPKQAVNTPAIVQLPAPKAPAAPPSAEPAATPAVSSGAEQQASRPDDPPAGTTSASPAAATTTNPVTPQPKAATAPQSAPAIASGNVSFSIQPWGEVYVDGKLIGVSPPLKQTKLAVGKYKVEIRNLNLPAHVAQIEVKAREEVAVKHKFQ